MSNWIDLEHFKEATEAFKNAFVRPTTSPFCSPSRTDVNGEIANVTDGLFAIADALNNVADALRGSVHHAGSEDKTR